MFDIFFCNLTNILGIFVAFLFNLLLDKRKNNGEGEGYRRILLLNKVLLKIIIITTIIVMHSTVMIAMPALLSLDIFRREEECR